MGSVYPRPDSPYLWLKWTDAAGKVQQRKTPLRKDDPEGRAQALKVLDVLEQRVRAEKRAAGGEGVLTVAAWLDTWGAKRERRLESADDTTRALRKYLVPHVGRMPVADVRVRHLADAFAAIRDEGRIAPKTVRNLYAGAHKLFQDAVRAEILTANPCQLAGDDLPAKEDADPTWRAQAIFSRGEVERLITEADHRFTWAFLFFLGVREGEASERRWRDYDTAAEPLHRMHVATSFSSASGRVKSTKSKKARQVPVHPVLARMLAEWRLAYLARFGRPPGPDELILGERMTNSKFIKRFHADLDALRMRERRAHDLRRTFISLMLGDGADREMLRLITHGPRGDVMADYTTMPWESLCRDVAKLRIRPLTGHLLEMPATGSYGGSMRLESLGKEVGAAGFESAAGAPTGPRALLIPHASGEAGAHRSPSEPNRRSCVATLAPRALDRVTEWAYPETAGRR